MCVCVCVFVRTAVYCYDPPACDTDTCSSTASEVDRNDVTGLYPYETVVDYTCLGGRKFDDGHASKSVSCSRNAQWNDIEIDCHREFV